MTGLKYDFDIGDLVVSSTGSFAAAVTDNQNVALIAVSQICRLTVPSLGAAIGRRLMNRSVKSAQPVLTPASKMAQKDGAKNAKVTIVDQHLEFSGEYED